MGSAGHSSIYHSLIIELNYPWLLALDVVIVLFYVNCDHQFEYLVGSCYIVLLTDCSYLGLIVTVKHYITAKDAITIYYY